MTQDFQPPELPSRRRFLRNLAAAGIATSLLARVEELGAAVVSGPGARPFDAEAPGAVRQLRGEYLLADDLAYLNHASIGTVPRAVVRAHAAYLEICESHPSLYVWGEVWREVAEDTRAAAAALLRCHADELAITHNTTEGFNILAHGLPLDRGDEVLFSSLNHPGASVAWDGLSRRRGFTVRRFDFPARGAPGLSADDVVSLHTDAIGEKTRALVVPHVDNVIGMTHPIGAIARAARARGVRWILVDGAQSAGMIPVDLASADVDAYAMSPHKWIQAPKGLGLLWISPALQPDLPRMWYRRPEETLDGTARIYEDYSTRAWPAVVALGDALAFQEALGAVEKRRRYAAMWRRVRERVEGDPLLSWRSPVEPGLRSMIVSVEVNDREASGLGVRLLETHGVVVRAFGPPLNVLRISPNLMTTDAEIDRFFVALAGA